MIKSAHSESTAVSLFPFLAVLICTMGVLIVLLVLAVKAADHNNQLQQTSDNDELRQAEALERDLEIEALRVEGLLDLRPSLQNKLAQARDLRGYLESETRELKRNLQQIELQIVAASEDTKSEVTISEITQEIDGLREQITEVQAQTDLIRSSKANAAPVYSIVPYQGNSGTSRRPIYIECTSQGLFIQPGNIQLTDQDFTFPVLNGNPLDATLAAVRQYQRRHNYTNENEQAYPLLVIRPGGESYFALARRAMTSWDDEFGYELVESDKVLDFGEPDEGLIAEIEETIKEALRKQERMVAVLEARGQKFQSPLANTSQNSSRPGRFGQENPTPSIGKATDSMGGGQTSAKRAESRASDSNSDTLAGQSQFEDEIARQEGVTDSRNSLASNSTSTSLTNPNGPQGNDAYQHGPINQEVEESVANFANSSLAQSSKSEGTQASRLNIQTDKRSENWALPASTSHAIAYRRPIQVSCYPDRFVFEYSANSNQRIATVSIDNSVEDSLDAFVHSIWNVIDGWGIAGSGGYWKPVLKIKLMPGGYSNFVQLERLLQNSGLEIEKGE